MSNGRGNLVANSVSASSMHLSTCCRYSGYWVDAVRILCLIDFVVLHHTRRNTYPYFRKPYKDCPTIAPEFFSSLSAPG